MHQLQMGTQRFQSALYRLGGEVPVWGNFGGQFLEILLPLSCQQFRRQLSRQQSAIRGILRLGSRNRCSWPRNRCAEQVRSQ